MKNPTADTILKRTFEHLDDIINQQQRKKTEGRSQPKEQAVCSNEKGIREHKCTATAETNVN